MYTFIKQWTTGRERAEIAARHGVKTRAQINNILNGSSRNTPLLDALMTRAEENKAKEEELKTRAAALGSHD